MPLAVGGGGTAEKVRDDDQELVGLDVGGEAPVANLEPVARGLVLKRRESRSPGVRLELLERRADEALILRGEALKFFSYALFEAERPEHG